MWEAQNVNILYAQAQSEVSERFPGNVNDDAPACCDFDAGPALAEPAT